MQPYVQLSSVKRRMNAFAVFWLSVEVPPPAQNSPDGTEAETPSANPTPSGNSPILVFWTPSGSDSPCGVASCDRDGLAAGDSRKTSRAYPFAVPSWVVPPATMNEPSAIKPANGLATFAGAVSPAFQSTSTGVAVTAVPIKAQNADTTAYFQTVKRASFFKIADFPIRLFPFYDVINVFNITTGTSPCPTCRCP